MDDFKISVVGQGDHGFIVYRSGEDIGCIAVSHNPCHAQHCYLNLGLTQYDPAISKALFSLLRSQLEKPLQVMLYASGEMHHFLTAGGFERRRRCFEIEVTVSDLTTPLHPCVELQTVQKGSALYDVCCRQLYDHYCATHRSVSPLTVPLEAFLPNLPETVICCTQEGAATHYAFVEAEEVGCEIAHVGTDDPVSFPGFAQTLLWTLFQKHSLLTAELDDTDPASMYLMGLFRIPTDSSYDTYILA